MRRWGVLAVLAVVCGALALGGAAGIRWERSLESALRSARRTRRPVMALFVDGAAASRSFEATTLTNAGVVQASRAWHCVRIDVRQAPAAAKARGVSAFPTVVFTDRSGKELGRLVGARPPAEWLADAKGALKIKVGGASEPLGPRRR